MISLRALDKIDIDSEWLLRIFTIIPVCLVLFAGLTVIWIYFFVLSLLPESKSVIDLPILSGDVRVVRDANGVPGIIAEHEDDLALVFGYTMAQDRLWQMDYFRRAGQGRLAEIFGRDYLDSDYLVRTLRAGKDVAKFGDELGEPDRKWLERFVLGINKFIAASNGKLPVEFSLLEYKPAPFSVDDVLSIAFVLAWASSPAADADLALMRMKSKFPGLFGKFSVDPACSEGLVLGDLKDFEFKGPLFSKQGRLIDSRFPGIRGGCAWAKSSPGQGAMPMVGCVLNQAISAPGFWYRAQLATKNFNISGAFLPGLPVAIAGTNSRMTWACTSSFADDVDFFMERFDSAETKNYWKVHRWKKIEEIKENFEIKGGTVEQRAVYLTDTGPLVTEISGNRALSLRWTGRSGQGLYSALYKLNRCDKGTKVKSALAGLTSPALKVVWADDDGGMGLQYSGKIPMRSPESDGIMPMPAWTGVHDWTGFIPYEELPSVNNPKNGVLATADERPGGTRWPVYIGPYWSNNGKYSRIVKMLEADAANNQESFQKIQMDTFSPTASELTPLILKSVMNRGYSGVENTATGSLAAWDFKMDADSFCATIFAEIYACLNEELFRKQMGNSIYSNFSRIDGVPARIIKSVFVDNIKSDLVADREGLLRLCFGKGIERLKTSLGTDVAAWKWGTVHQAEFKHPLTVRSRFLEAVYNIGPVKMPGSMDTINYALWSPADPFGVIAAVSLRHIGDVNQPAQAFDVMPLGTSAHFFSRHYKDQTRPWLTGRLLVDPTQISDIRKNGFNPVIFRGSPKTAQVR